MNTNSLSDATFKTFFSYKLNKLRRSEIIPYVSTRGLIPGLPSSPIVPVDNQVREREAPSGISRLQKNVVSYFPVISSPVCCLFLWV